MRREIPVVEKDAALQEIHAAVSVAALKEVFVVTPVAVTLGRFAV